MLGTLVRLPKLSGYDADVFLGLGAEPLMRLGTVLSRPGLDGRCRVMHVCCEGREHRLVIDTWDWHDLTPVRISRDKSASDEWRAFCEAAAKGYHI